MAERSTNSKTEVNCKLVDLPRRTLTSSAFHRLLNRHTSSPRRTFHGQWPLPRFPRDGKPSSYGKSAPHHAAYSDTDIASFKTSPEHASKRRRFSLSAGNGQLLWGVADEHTMHPPPELQRDDGEDNSPSDLMEQKAFPDADSFENRLNSFPPPPSLLRLAQDLSPSPSRSSSRESSLTPLPPELPDGPQCSPCHSTKSSNGS
ncbi:hypothetical protein FB451DRAFT_1559242 [Mycena latifolia]|nr:hypothetical protein FB451DRAFT_1559242 [Mycena latifolia]